MSEPVMRAAVFAGPMQVRIAHELRPEPAAGQVRVRLEGCGVCGSNGPVWEGRPWFDYPFPAGAPGHEGWGRVDAVGEGVDDVLEGARVALLSTRAFAEYDVAPADSVAVLPEAVGSLPFPGEPLACAFNVFTRSDVRAGQDVAVVGVGFLGAVLVALAARAGARVFALSRRPFALDIARHYGAAVTISMEDPRAAAALVGRATGGAGCDRVIEAVGLQAPLDLASELTRERGRLVIAGYHQDGPRQVDMQSWNWRGIDVVNAHERDPAVYVHGMRAAARAVAQGDLNVAPLFTHSVPLEDLGYAFRLMQDRPAGFLKVLAIP